ncbi:uncharacterized protein LOC121592122 [Anopheles merus]|nr:uncharacterized protein LOC121592122 [Anopheles merus]
MITKQRLSANNSLDGMPTPISGCESNSAETPLDVMPSGAQCSFDQQSNDCTTQRRGSSQKKRLPGLLLSDDSCNAVDNMLGVDEKPTCENTDPASNLDLSFNGKIKPLTAESQGVIGPVAANTVERSTKDEAELETETRKSSDDSRICDEKLNESFELLTKENNSLSHYNNEKSPDLFADDDEDDDDNDDEDDGNDDEEGQNASERNGDGGRQGECEDYLHRSQARTSGASIKEMESANESSVDRTDRILLKRMQMSLAGIPPPPALTYSDIDIGTMLTIYRSNVEPWLATHGFRTGTAKPLDDSAAGVSEPGEKLQQQPCLMKPTHTTDELAALKWPELTHHRAHGLHYNRSGVTETIELLGLKYIERYISAETSCSFNMTVLQSSAKKRNQRLKLLNQSPGRRLSHLARRRATFSSESLLNNSGSKGGSIVSAGKGTIDAGVLRRLNPHRVCNNRQVLLDPKKSDNRRKNKIKTPKRRTPGGKKSPRRRTPGSSAKKLSLLRTNAGGGKSCSQVHVPATRESSKRALFLSPQNGGTSSATSRNDRAGSNSKQLERSLFSDARVLKSKRSLFSPVRGTATEDKGNPPAASGVSGAGASSSSTVSNKRRRSSITDSGETERSGERTEKIRRTEAAGLTEEDLTPRSLKFARSRSFCVGVRSMTLPSASAVECVPIVGGRPLIRASSDICSEDGPRPVAVLTENHKKKLLWAVSQALQSKQITTKHELFKRHASILARVVKRLFLEFNDQTISSTSEKMLKLANKHVYEVIQGKSEHEIYFREKTRLSNARNLQKLQGYIAPEEYELRRLKRTASTTSFDATSPFDCSLSASQSFLSQSSILSQGSSFGGGLSQLSQPNGFTRGGAGSAAAGVGHLKPAASTGSVNTVGLLGASIVGSLSSSTALRENVDSELRQRSTKKQLLFSGKDQKNLSPYRMDKSLSLIGGVGGGGNVGNKLLVGGAANSSIMKAKRQISFE